MAHLMITLVGKVASKSVQAILDQIIEQGIYNLHGVGPFKLMDPTYQGWGPLIYH